MELELLVLSMEASGVVSEVEYEDSDEPEVLVCDGCWTADVDLNDDGMCEDCNDSATEEDCNDSATEEH